MKYTMNFKMTKRQVVLSVYVYILLKCYCRRDGTDVEESYRNAQ